jgi:hypothetical protein
MIKYYAVFNKIEKVEVLRQTDKCVFLSETNRMNKKTDWYCYSDTFQEAKDFLINLSTYRISKYKDKLLSTQTDIDNETKKMNDILILIEDIKQ